MCKWLFWLLEGRTQRWWWRKTIYWAWNGLGQKFSAFFISYVLSVTLSKSSCFITVEIKSSSSPKQDMCTFTGIQLLYLSFIVNRWMGTWEIRKNRRVSEVNICIPKNHSWIIYGGVRLEHIKFLGGRVNFWQLLWESCVFLAIIVKILCLTLTVLRSHQLYYWPRISGLCWLVSLVHCYHGAAIRFNQTVPQRNSWKTWSWRIWDFNPFSSTVLV